MGVPWHVGHSMDCPEHCELVVGSTLLVEWRFETRSAQGDVDQSPSLDVDLIFREVYAIFIYFYLFLTGDVEFRDFRRL